jgi:hypothetical protein
VVVPTETLEALTTGAVVVIVSKVVDWTCWDELGDGVVVLGLET